MSFLPPDDTGSNDPTFSSHQTTCASRPMAGIDSPAFLPICGANRLVVTTAVQLAPCPSMAREIIERFCSVGLGDRLIPIPQEDGNGKALWPTIDARLTAEDLVDVENDRERQELVSLLRMWASMVPQPFVPLGGVDGWIGARRVRRAGEAAQTIWPVVYPPFSIAAYAEHLEALKPNLHIVS